MPGNIYDRISHNKRASLLLVAIMMCLLAAVGYAIGVSQTPGGGLPGVGFACALAVIVSLFTYFGGDGVLLAVSQARRIGHDDAPQLFNVVEEVAIAAGVPMPKVYVIDDTAPNAFATGRDPRHASVAITTGLLEKLNRDELQGVMAHEMSHIGNRDILFAMLMGVMVGSVALMCDFFLRMTFLGRRRRSGGGGGRGGGPAQAIILIIALVLAILAPFFAKMIQLAVSRRREYLADASAARLTRNPLGLASALWKISSDREVLEAANRATQHMYIVNPIKPFEDRARAMFSTHPPIEERIRLLSEMAYQYEKRQA